MPLSSITDRRLHIQPAEVHSVLGRHMLADGYDIVMDLRKSKGSWVFDAKRGRAVLDFFTNFATCPIGYNHPRLDTPEFRERIADVAINKPANSDIYTTYMAEFVDTSARRPLGVPRGSGARKPRSIARNSSSLSARTTSPRSSWSRSRVKAATTTSAPNSSKPSASCATKTKCFSSSTKCSPVSA